MAADLTKVLPLAADRRFADAATALLHDLPSDAQQLRQLARELLRARELSPFGSNVGVAEGMEAFYEPVADAIVRKLGSTAEESIALVERLTMIHAYAHRFDEAAATLRPIYDEIVKGRSESDPLVQRLRYMLKTQYENAGRRDEADALLPQIEVCQHLRKVDDYLRSQGVQVMEIGTPWSKNCRHWVIYRGVVLDTASLVQRFGLTAPVEVHDHRGTHDGSEHGLYCGEHHDALIGAHPSAGAGLRVVG